MNMIARSFVIGFGLCKLRRLAIEGKRQSASTLTTTSYLRLAAFFSAVFLFLTAAAYGSTPDTTVKNSGKNLPYHWSLFSYPTKNHLTALSMVGSTEGFLAEKYLMHYLNGAWTIFPQQPPVANFYQIFATGPHDIWTVDYLYTYESELYHFDGARWMRMSHPFANLIDAIHFRSNSTGWIGGTGELAYYDGRRWSLVAYPPSRSRVRRIYGVSKEEVWVLTSNGEVFFWKNHQWTRVITETSVTDFCFLNDTHAFAVSPGKLFEWRNGQWLTHSTDELLREILRISAASNGEIWGIGPRGSVAHFNGARWNKVPVPTDLLLTDIQMLSERDGWIIGENGIVLRYSAQSVQGKPRPEYGFDLIQMAPLAREINDEYGVAIEDFNNDGLNDVLAVCLYEPNRLYINTSTLSPTDKNKILTLKFSEEAVVRGVTGLSEDSRALGASKISLGVGVADVDNDGAQDIYICNLAAPNKLFLNNGKGYFRDVSNKPGRASGGFERSNAAIFGDVNNDGFLDLFVTNEESSNRLYLNDGTGHFTDVTEAAGLKTVAGGMGASFADIDGDGRLDLCVANWSMPNRLYRNVSTQKDGVRFVDVTEQSGIGGEPYGKSNAVLFADFNNDGFLDLFITKRGRPNRLYINDGAGRFTDRTAEMIGLDSMLSYGASAADFDNDGYLDLFVANVGESILYHNLEGRKFVPATDQFGARLRGYCTGTATGDIDNDGDIDLYTGVFINGSSTLFVNTLNNRDYLMIDVEGTKSNRDAIGAKVCLYPNGFAGRNESLLGYREINGGNGYGSRSSRQVHFGVHEGQRYDVVVFFPASGIKKVLSNVAAGQRFSVREEDGMEASITLFSKSIRRFVIDPETHTELAKLGLVIIMLTASILTARKRYQWGVSIQTGLHGSVLLVYFVQISFFLHEKVLLSTVLPISSVMVILAIVHLWYDRIIMVRRAELYHLSH